MKIPLAVAGVILLGSSLAACSGSDSGSGGGGNEADYCKELASAKTSFAKVAGNDLDALDSAIQTFHTLADKAPSEVAAEWKTLDGAFATIEKGFEDAGIKMSDLADIQAGKIPEGADVSKLSSLASSFSEISSKKVTDAQDVIEKHAKDACDVELGTP